MADVDEEVAELFLMEDEVFLGDTCYIVHLRLNRLQRVRTTYSWCYCCNGANGQLQHASRFYDVLMWQRTYEYERQYQHGQLGLVRDFANRWTTTRSRRLFDEQQCR